MSTRKTTTKPDAPTASPPAPYDPEAFQLARDDIRDLITMPLQAWTLIPPAVRKESAYTALLSVPWIWPPPGMR